jgi:hypothetical protein
MQRRKYVKLFHLYFSAGAHPREGGFRAVATQTPQNRNLKNTNFVDTIISKVLSDLHFSWNQSLKPADD